MPFNPFAKSAELDILTDRASYRPGDEVTVQIAVRADGDLKIEEGWVELIARHRYTYRDRERDHEGRSRTVRKTTTDNDVVALKLFLGEGTVPSGSHPEQTLSLRLPRMAPPTGNGSITAVSWLARAALNVKWANDPDAEVPITVLSSEDRSTHGARSHPTVDTGGAVDLEFDLPSRVVHTGSVIAGKLHVVPREEVEAREVRIELVRRETVRRDEGLHEETIERRVASDLDRPLTPGQDRSFPFSFYVPVTACPVLDTSCSSVRWYLRGVINRRFRSDYTVTLGINVATTP